MFPLIGGLLSGGASLLGSIFSSNTSAQNTQAQIAASEQQQQTQNQFQEQMSNTAYQRASADMKAAGLNPMMMFGSGSAASSPSGSSIQAPMPQTKSALGDLGDAVSKAFSSALQVKTFDKMTEEIANLQTDRAKMEAATALTQQQTKTEEQDTLRGSNVNSLLGLKMPGARFSAKSAEDLLSMPDWLRKTLVIGGYGGDKVSDTLRPVTDLISSARDVRSLMPRRSTSEVTSSRTGESTFHDRWDGLYN